MRAQQPLLEHGNGLARWVTLGLAICFSTACGDQPWNSPYPPEQAGANILYSSFAERPKHLDPAQSYSSNEIVFTGQIYEPPLQYHFLKRPYQLEPLTVTEVPEPFYLDADGQRLGKDAPADSIAFSVYDIEIKPGIHYQPHPAFARDEQGSHRYHALDEQDLASVNKLSDFPETGSRELTAADYVYQIKRLAHPRLHSPIYGLMTDYIVGLKKFGDQLRRADDRLKKLKGDDAFLDLNKFEINGVEVVDRYTYTVKIKRRD